MLADGIGQDSAAFGNLFADTLLGFDGQQRVRERVIADYMASLCNVGGNIRSLPDITSDHEKRCMYVVLLEHLKQAQRVRIVGAVVEGQRNLLRPRLP